MKFINLALLALISHKLATALRNFQNPSKQNKKINKKALPPPLEIKPYNALLIAVT